MHATAKPILAHVRQLADDSKELSDRVLLGRFVAGEGEAFTQLVARHGPMVLGVCKRLIGETRCDDAFQAAFLALSRRAKSLARMDSLAGWLHTVARNAALRIIRDESRHHALDSLDGIAAKTPSPPDELSARELLAVLDAEVSRLPDVYRLPLLLCFWQGLTQEQAAARLGWSAGSVKGRLERGRKCLARRLTRRGYGLHALLLAPLGAAAVSADLQAAAARLPYGNASAHVVKLAASLTAGAIIRRSATAMIVGSVVAVVIAAAGSSEPPPAKPADEPATPAPAVTARTDRFGDPLPDGALMRLGTVSFRLPQVGDVAFRPTGELVAVTFDQTMSVWPATGSAKPILKKVSESPGSLERIAISADARFVAGTGRWPRQVVVWDIAGEKPIEYLSCKLLWPDHVKFSPNGEWLAVIQRADPNNAKVLLCNMTSKVWDEIPLETKFVVSESFTSDGKFLVVSDFDVVSVFETATRKQLFTRKTSSTHSVALSPDGKTLAVQSWAERNVRLWSMPDGKDVTGLTPPNEDVSWLSYSADGRHLFLGGKHGMREWELASGKLVHKFEGPAECPVAHSQDGRRLASCSLDSVLLWDAATGVPVWPELLSAGHMGAIEAIRISPNGKVIATSGRDDAINLWAADSGRLLSRIRAISQPPVFLPDSKSLICISVDSVTPIVCDAESGKELRRFQVSEELAKKFTTNWLRLSADGKTLTAVAIPQYAGVPGFLPQWDVASGKAIGRANPDFGYFGGPEYGATISPDGQWRVLEGTVSRIDAKESTRLVPNGMSTYMTTPKFASDNRLVAVVGIPERERGLTNARARIFVYDLAARSGVIDVPTEGNVPAIAFSRDGSLLGVANRFDIVVWDLLSGGQLRRFHGEKVIRGRAIAFTPDGRRLVTGHSDCTALVWDIGGLPAPTPLSQIDLARAWNDLASDDAPKAIAAEWDLANRSQEAVLCLRDHLKPVQPADAKAVNKLVADLDANEYAKREAASKGLRQLGESAIPQLRDKLRSGLSAEARSRVEKLVSEIAVIRLLPAERRRELRAVSVLEKAGTDDAKNLLRALAAGVEQARLTSEARMALERLRESAVSAAK